MKIKDFINGEVTYDNCGQYFWIKTPDGNQMLAELRGWGAIQNRFKDKKGDINMSAAADFQDEIGMWIAQAINDTMKREVEQFKISSNPVLSEVSPTSEQYPDNEADGIVFCGKCGAKK